jgi:carboxyl-terminal processing protease
MTLRIRRRSPYVQFALCLGALACAACGASPDAGSIGAILGRDEESKAVYVRDIPEAASEVDLLAGDEIVMIDGVYVRDLSTKDLRRRLRGEPGSRVKLTLLRGSAVVRVEIVRTPLKEVVGRAEEKVDER